MIKLPEDWRDRVRKTYIFTTFIELFVRTIIGGMTINSLTKLDLNSSSLPIIILLFLLWVVQPIFDNLHEIRTNLRRKMDAPKTT